MTKGITKLRADDKLEFTIDEIEMGNFESEKSIEDYFYKNINAFMETVFDEKVINAERQKYIVSGYIQISNTQILPKRGPRVDLYVECESGNNYLLEIKNPRSSGTEAIKAIGQIMYYSTLFPKANKLAIVSSVYDEGFMQVIKKFDLDIDFVLIGKGKTYLLKR